MCLKRKETCNLSGTHNTLNPVAKDDSSSKLNMMDLWRESIQRNQKAQGAPVGVAESEEETTADLEQKIRNGQAECPTCSARTYKDESDDGGVSFQAGKRISSSSAGTVITNHEHEHVAEKASKNRDSENELVHSSTVHLEHATCPECGRTYIAGAVTKTTTRPASYTNAAQTPGSLDALA